MVWKIRHIVLFFTMIAFVNACTNKKEIAELKSKISDLQESHESLSSTYSEEIERLKTQYSDLKRSREVLASEYSALKSTHESILKDLNENRIITQTQLLKLSERELGALVSHFDEYNAAFRSFLAQVEWVESNLTPLVREYSLYAKGTLFASGILPIPYVKSVTDSLSWCICVLEDTGKYTALVNDLQSSMIRIRKLYLGYRESNENHYLIDACTETSEVFYIKFGQLLDLAETLRSACETSSDALNKMKGMKEQATQYAKSGLTKLANWVSGSPSQESAAKPGNELPQPSAVPSNTEDSFDRSIAQLIQKTEAFKKDLSSLSEKFKEDTAFITNLNAYRKSLSLIGSPVPSITTRG